MDELTRKRWLRQEGWKRQHDDSFDAAMAIVLSLAEQNIIDRRDNPSEYRRQKKAVVLIRETFGILD